MTAAATMQNKSEHTSAYERREGGGGHWAAIVLTCAPPHMQPEQSGRTCDLQEKNRQAQRRFREKQKLMVEELKQLAEVLKHKVSTYTAANALETGSCCSGHTQRRWRSTHLPRPPVRRARPSHTV